MKNRILLLIVVFITMAACKPKTNQIVFDEAANQEILYGFANYKAFESEVFSRWYLTQYSEYVVDIDYLDSIKPYLNDLTIMVVLGTWCGDSRREVPRFIKILNEVNFPTKNLKIVGVNRAKVCPEAGVETGFVDFVPTFIVYREGQEIGRIIEHPLETLEMDLFKIVTNK
jgi:thiol-disulfide isomerase/thioredoxin